MITARRSRRRSNHRAALTLVLVLAGSMSAVAHRRDEYLQAARIAIEPDRVDIFLDLTPGIAVSERVLAEVDGDRSGSISSGEAAEYARLLLRSLELDIDGSRLAIALVNSSPPTVEAVRGGEGSIRVIASARMPQLAAGAHRLRYRNNFRSDLGAYLANALVPSSELIAVTAQRRDVDQRELTIEYTLVDAPHGANMWKRTGGITAACLCVGVLWRARRSKLSLQQ